MNPSKLSFPHWRRPERPRLLEVPAWAQPPAGQLPGLILQRPLLIEQPNARVTMRDIDVYSTGFMARVEATIAYLPAVPWISRSRDLSAQLHAVFSTLLDRLDVTVEMDTMPRSPIWHANFWPRDPSRTPPAHPGPLLLTSQGGGSSRHEVYCKAVWIPNLPHEGSVRFGVTWPSVAKESTVVEIPSTEFTAAAAQVVQLW